MATLGLSFIKQYRASRNLYLKASCSTLTTQTTDGSQDSAYKGYAGLILYIPSAICAYLFYWQIRRKQWKEGLVAQREAMLTQEPHDIYECTELRPYERVSAEGVFAADETIFLGPRPKSVPANGTMQCYHLITPLYNPERKSAVLVNRGYVPKAWLSDPELLKSITPQGRVRVIGIIQDNEKPSALFPDNQPERGEFSWFDVPLLVHYAGLPRGTPLIQILDTAPDPIPIAPPQEDKPVPEAPVKPSKPSLFTSLWSQSKPSSAPTTPPTPTPSQKEDHASGLSPRREIPKAQPSSAPTTPPTPTPSQNEEHSEGFIPRRDLPVTKPEYELRTFVVDPQGHVLYAALWASLCVGSAFIAFRVTRRRPGAAVFRS